MAREAVERLRAWDFRMDADKVEPLLFTAWLRTFAHSMFSRHLGEAAAEYWDLRPQVIEAVLAAVTPRTKFVLLDHVRFVERALRERRAGTSTRRRARLRRALRRRAAPSPRAPDSCCRRRRCARPSALAR